jgi:hypothetical protein
MSDQDDKLVDRIIHAIDEIGIEIKLEPLDEIDTILPVGTRLKFGAFAPQLTSPLLKGHTYVTLVFGGITGLRFPEDAKRGTMREHTQHAGEAYVLPEPLGRLLLEACRKAHATTMNELFPAKGPIEQAIDATDDDELDDITEDELQEQLREERAAEEAEAIAAAAEAGVTAGADDGWPEHAKAAGGEVGESIEERVRDVVEPKSPRELERERHRAEQLERDASLNDDGFHDPALAADDAQRAAGEPDPAEEEL